MKKNSFYTICEKLYLSEINGGVWFMDKICLSTTEIISISNDLQECRLWKSSYFPICGDISNLLILNQRGEVCEWDDEDGCGDLISDSLSEYLEDYRNSLLDGKFEFIKEIGVVEKMTSRTATSRK